MFGLYPADQVRKAEDELLETVPEGSLMQLAARGLAIECLTRIRGVCGGVQGVRVVALVGAGNNGGDALFASEYLQRRGLAVTVILVAPTHVDEGLPAFVRSGGNVIPVANRSAVDDAINKADLIIDGIVGIGARGPLRQPASEVVARANASRALRIAVDIPSGIDPDDGTIPGEAFVADATVTFGCVKPGLLLEPGRSRAGAVRVVDIGLTNYLPEPSFHVIEPDDVAELLLQPGVDAHKYRRGVVGIVAGSTRYPGAGILTVGAARYSGVGLVRFLDRSQGPQHDGVSSRVVTAYPDVVIDRGAVDDDRLDRRIRAWACGPGLTDSDLDLVETTLAVDDPVVLDAGALQCLAASESLQSLVQARGDRGSVTVLTPHAGELTSLCSNIQGIDGPRDLAQHLRAIVVRKGPGTTIFGFDGSAWVDAAGTSALACAGSGDVLTGLTAGMLAACRDAEPVVVVAGAVWLHGTSGRWASRGGRPVVATDILEAIPETIARTRSSNLAEWML